MRKFKTFSNIYAPAGGAALSEAVIVAPVGTRCVLGAFAIDLTLENGADGVDSYTFTDLPRVAFQSMDASFTTRFAVPAVISHFGVVNLTGQHAGVLNKVPGPGIMFDDGMRFQIDIPAILFRSLHVSVNLVYSV
ncbi:MAG TPA: hypothetical protein EYO58_07555 [Flavobacteriales bacterium]|nr:hypothetical protein [Flavobacteriales bacterium]